MSFIHRSPVWRITLATLVAAILISAPRPAAAGTTCLVPPVPARVAVPFRAPACRWCPGQRGLEYANRAGIEVWAAGAGTVIFAGQVAGVVWVTVDHGGGLRTTYGPLRRVLVRRGTTVAPGTPIASAAGPLHFGVRVDGRYVDPANLLARPVHLVPRLFSPSARIARPPVLPCGATSPFRFAARSR